MEPTVVVQQEPAEGYLPPPTIEQLLGLVDSSPKERIAVAAIAVAAVVAEFAASAVPPFSLSLRLLSPTAATAVAVAAAAGDYYYYRY